MRSKVSIGSLLLQQLKPLHKPKPTPQMINYAKFIGKISSRRQPSIIRELLKILATASPDMMPLSGGLPNPEMFPFKEATFTLKDGSKVPIKGDSMLPLREGAFVVGRFIDGPQQIKSGSTYILVTINEGIVYKRVCKKGNQLELH